MTMLVFAGPDLGCQIQSPAPFKMVKFRRVKTLNVLNINHVQPIQQLSKLKLKKLELIGESKCSFTGILI